MGCRSLVLEREIRSLKNQTKKLKSFLGRKDIGYLHRKDRELLQQQYEVMTTYIDILEARLARVND